MKIQVTQQHIEQGKHCDPLKCPVALAITAAGVNHAGVTQSRLVVGDNWIFLPDAVYNWIARFDARKPVSPIEFEVDL